MKKRLLFLLLLSGMAAHAGKWHRGYRHHGRWGRGWGWGPAVGVGFTVPLGGSSYVAPAAPYKSGDPFYRYERLFNSSPNKNKKAYRRWLFDNYSTDNAQYWWNFFVNNHYRPYKASRPQPTISFGVGGGWGGGYYGRPWGRRGGYWW